jgi:hypothetical protein
MIPVTLKGDVSHKKETIVFKLYKLKLSQMT